MVMSKMDGNNKRDSESEESFDLEVHNTSHSTPPPIEDGIFPMLSWHASELWTQLTRNTRQCIADIGIYDLLENLARKAVLHPFLTLGLALTTLSVALPLLVITVFAFSALVMTFSGFVLLEGTLISISSVLLFGCLGAMAIVFIFFGGVAVAGYFGFLHIYDLYQGIHNKSAITDYLKRERVQTSS